MFLEKHVAILNFVFLFLIEIVGTCHFAATGDCSRESIVSLQGQTRGAKPASMSAWPVYYSFSTAVTLFFMHFGEVAVNAPLVAPFRDTAMYPSTPSATLADCAALPPRQRHHEDCEAQTPWSLPATALNTDNRPLLLIWLLRIHLSRTIASPSSASSHVVNHRRGQALAVARMEEGGVMEKK